MVRRAARSRSDETRFHLRDGSLHKSRAQKRTLPARAPVAGGHPAQSLQNGDFGRRPSPSRPDGGKDFRRTDQRRPVRGLGGDMPRPHALARRDRRHGQSPAHKGPRVEQRIGAAGAELRYLPAYSPDINPIEKAFSKLKAFLRKIAERTVAGLLAALDACADIFKPAECENYFRACGYDPDGEVNST